MSSATAITNLLYRYAECISNSDFAGAAGLFNRAQLKVAWSDVLVGSKELLHSMQQQVIADPGRKTKPVVSNTIIEIDEATGTATCRSYYTVIQSAPGVPLQAIAAGRYHDRFARTDGEWHFTFRDYTMLDMTGDLSGHIRQSSTRVGD